ncbi:hypothetical protein PQX77_009778 [Marasmius sp. AFHP31]|nr:hypothetical protein PQX77_009778 [Marasmius sp. AFHP31]
MMFYDYNEPLLVPMSIDDFTLDPRYTDDSSTTPELTMMSSEDDDVSREMDLEVTDDPHAGRRGATAAGSHAWGTASYAQDDVTETVEKEQQEPEDEVDPMEEEFARLEAWLNSSAVEIVPGYRG